MQLIIELPPRQEQLEFNHQRWAEIVADHDLSKLPYRIEMNAYGQVIMNPPPSGEHSHRQGRITIVLDQLLSGTVIPECPISTVDGVKAADVGWYSEGRFAAVRGQLVFERAPEICIEVLSPSNTDSEMRAKRQLYFEAGAEEVWICDLQGTMQFYHVDHPAERKTVSQRCPDFPTNDLI